MARSSGTTADSLTRCPSCGTETSSAALRASAWLCPSCGWHLVMPARDRLVSLVDPGTFKEFDRRLVSGDPLRFADQRAYRARLLEARRRTGLREAVVVGQAKIGGLPVVLAVFDFEFMGGTMGSVVGEKIADAFEVATKRRLPVITVTSSGGARMQEGMLSLMQMAKTAAARARHNSAGLAHISVLGHPTFGGVAASFASLGDVLIAEPGAQIGFVGPRVIEATMGESLPPDSHRAERLFAGGMVDLLLDSILWPDQPLGRDVAGTPESVAHVSRDMAKELRFPEAGEVDGVAFRSVTIDADFSVAVLACAHIASGRSIGGDEFIIVDQGLGDE